MNLPTFMAVGPREGLLEGLEDALARLRFKVQHTPLARTALELVVSRRPAVIVVAFPLIDMRDEEFIESLKSNIVSQNETKVILIADEPHATRLVPYLDEHHVLLSPIWEPEMLQRYIVGLLPAEMRTVERVMLRLQVEMAAGQRLWICQTSNISETGVLVRTEHLLPVGIHLRLAISLPRLSEPIEVAAEVVRHTEPEREDIRGIGLRFLTFHGRGQELLREYLGTEGA